MEQVTVNGKMKLSQHLALPSEAALSHPSKLDGVRLTPHFTLGELTKSNHTEVYNIPSHQAIENLKRVCEWLEELRARVGVPIIINSGYRSPQLNKRVGGSATSNHLTGCAVDIRVDGIEQAIRYAAILLNIADDIGKDFDEILIEKNRYGAMWLHFAVRPPSMQNRRKIAFIKA